MDDNSINSENAAIQMKAGIYIAIKDNLALRTATILDAKHLCKWWNDGKVMEHAGFPKGLNTNEDEIIEHIKNENDNHRRIIIEIDSSCVGEMSFRIKNDIAEIGIKICDFSYQEKGYGTKAIKLLIEYLFHKRKVQKIILDTNLKNTRAQHVYEKIGFKKVKVNYNAWQDQVGVLQSFVDYELLKENYERKETVLRNLATIYLKYDNQILMLKRIGSRIFDNPMWIGTGGGHFEQDELNHPLQCVLREIKEEMGIEENEIQDISLKYIALCNIKGEVRQIYYYFGEFKEKPRITPVSNEGELQWVDIDQLFHLEMPFTASECLKHYFAEGEYNNYTYVAAVTNKEGKAAMYFTELLEY
ncbi:MAG: hypothetical protein K0S01_4165 [Herbinix sp.]|jgi:RimJ/RimL family protein N-acetyltransferase/8-oxo-dGTP pyrophosphatase MutT (NUDIX family)|nr:hypothetical protein [Herbinix sp.]